MKTLDSEAFQVCGGGGASLRTPFRYLCGNRMDIGPQQFIAKMRSSHVSWLNRLYDTLDGHQVVHFIYATIYRALQTICRCSTSEMPIVLAKMAQFALPLHLPIH